MQRETVRVAAIGRTTAAALLEHDVHVAAVAAAPTPLALAAAITLAETRVVSGSTSEQPSLNNG